METASIIVVVAGSLLTAACVAWFVLARKHPENAATHDDASPATTSENLYAGVDRPAGPDAEPMDPDELGGDQRAPSPD